MTEEEEFEFRLRFEREQEQAPSAVERYFSRNAQIPPEYGEVAPIPAQIGRGMMDVYQGGKQLGLNVAGRGDDYNRQIQEELALYNRNNPGFQPARLAGNIATPLSLIPGAAGSGMARAASIPIAGGLFGSIQPVENTGNFFGQKAAQAGIGALTAPILPLAGKAASLTAGGIRHLRRPFSDAGITEDLSDLLIKESMRKGPGGEESLNKVVSALRNRKTYVQGNKPTVAQAIADASRGSGDDFGAALVRLEKDLTSQGVEGEVLRSTAAAQAMNRKAAIDAIKGTPEQLAKAVARRKGRADRLYDMVRRSKAHVDTDVVAGKIDELIDRNPLRRKVTEPMQQIKNALAEADGSPRALMSLSEQIKDMSNLKNAAGKNEYSNTALASVKKILDEEIGQSERAFKVAQSWYRKSSKPINQMKVGKELAEALQSSLESETPSTFTNAIRNAPRTIKRGTGVGVYDNLEKILNPSQLKQVQAVHEELLRQKHQALVANSVKSVFGDIKEGIEPRLPRILERSVVIANHVLKKLDVDKTPDYQRVAVDILRDPDRLLTVLKLPKKSIQRQIAMEMVRQLSVQVPAQTSGREIARQ